MQKAILVSFFIIYIQKKVTNNFSVFKDKNTKKADFRDLMVGVEIFRETSFNQKIEELVKICDI